MIPSTQSGFTASLPTKRMAAGALFLNESGEVLIVKPTYRDDWLIPGGAVERDESPHQACKREIEEELGVTLPVHQLLCIEYQSAHERKTESLQLIFYGGVLSGEQIRGFSLPATELAEYRFCTYADALMQLNVSLAQRLEFAWQALLQGRTIYLENKKEIAPLAT